MKLMAASAKAAHVSNGHRQEAATRGNGATSSCRAVPETSAMGPTHAALRHNPGLSLEWTAEEQSLLESLLTEHASDPPLNRYCKIAQQFENKTVRDVAFRCRWMSKKENGKRRKDELGSARRNKERKDKVSEPMAKPNVPNWADGPAHVQPLVSTNDDDGISYKDIGGVAGQLLEQTARALDKISANFPALKLYENISLFCQARSNILAILNDTTDIPEFMKQMPPLPEKLNEELANSILPQAQLP